MADNIKKFFQETPLARLIGGIILCITIVVIALIIFLAGESFGYHRVEFSYNMMANHMMLPGDGTFIGSHGASGIVVAVNLPNIIVSDDDGVEKTIVLNGQTILRKFSNRVASSSITEGDEIIVIGSPDTRGRIVASLVRILPIDDATSSPSNF